MIIGATRQKSLIIVAAILATVFLFLCILFVGAVDIPFEETIKILKGREGSKAYWHTIIIETRLPMAMAAAFSGASLSVAGLMMQTTFHNALAGPSVLGVTSGASLGVAIVVLSDLFFVFPEMQNLSIVAGAIIGAGITILLLLFFSSVLRNGIMLLIVGIMISYLCSSLISLLNYFSPAEEIRGYLVWGLGSFSGLDLQRALWLMILSILVLIPSLYYSKPLNSLLLGERYSESLGYSAKNLRMGILIITGLLVAIPTAYCGPIGFVGLIVPHLCRMVLRTSNHLILMPSCMVFGAGVSLLCAFICILPSAAYSVLPINVITPFIGVPVIVYLLVNRKRIIYFQ